jgi:cysteine-rich repeat protein
MQRSRILVSRPIALVFTLSFACADDLVPENDAPPIDTTARGACPAMGSCSATPRVDLSTTLFLGTPFPTSMDPGEKIAARAVMQNTGPGTWDSNRIRFNSTHEPRFFFGSPYSSVVPTIAVGGLSNHDVIVRAPLIPGTYTYDYVMRETIQSGGFNFGTHFTQTIVVQPQQRVWDCAYVSDTSPRLVGVGRGTSVSFTLQNSGQGTWQPSLFRLCENDNNQWGAQECEVLSQAVPPGGQVTVNTTLWAPTTPGTYILRREMKDVRSTGVQLFEDDPARACVQFSITAQLCGDNIPFNDPSEQCDDGNTINGDGCSESCQHEGARVVDLLNDTADRSVFGSSLNRGLGNVVFGNVVGDDVQDVCVGEIDDVAGVDGRARGTAGRVSCYNGATFFGGADDVAPNGADLVIIGATKGDHVGGSESGRIVIIDVTADGVPDLLVSAPFADGPDELRTNSGEVYVIAGNGTTPLSGTIDLLAPPPGVSVTRIFGAAANDNLRILGAGDFDGDIARDLVISAAGSDTNGAEAGAIYIVQGGMALGTGVTIDLGTTTPYATLLGPSPGEPIGLAAAIGDLIGTTFRDLVISSRNMTFLGRANAGVAWVMQGPIAPGTYNLATDYGLRFVGGSAGEHLGSAIAIGNVKGATSRLDLVLGIPSARDVFGEQIGRVDVWEGPITVPPGDRTIDTAVTSASTQIWGIDDDDHWGSSISLGQWNHDSRADMAIGGSATDGPGNTRDASGEMVVVLGHQNLPAQLSLGQPAPLRVYGANSRDMMGAHVLNTAFGTDLDGNGRFDVCVGTYRGLALREGRVDCFAAP